MNGSRVPEPRGRESGMALLRALVAGYVIYLGVTMILDRIAGRSEMPLWLSWTCGVFFVLVGAGFGWYTLKMCREETANDGRTAEEVAYLNEEIGRKNCQN